MTKPSSKLAEAGQLLRLEIALPIENEPVWHLLDWVKDGTDTIPEMLRVLQRFNRIVLSLRRQSGGVRAKNEPYARVMGVRCKMGNRVIGVHPALHHEQLTMARTATSKECPAELEFTLALTARLRPTVERKATDGSKED